jgi:hypothetical protein
MQDGTGGGPSGRLSNQINISHSQSSQSWSVHSSCPLVEQLSPQVAITGPKQVTDNNPIMTTIRIFRLLIFITTPLEIT